jgi:hypothetical protein
MKNCAKSHFAIFSAFIAAGLIATAVQAANPAGPKPQCALGQVAQIENGAWKCKALPITSKPQQEADGRAKNRRVELKISY